MKKAMGTSMLMATLAIGSVFGADRMTLNGAGASFPAPVYSVWTYNYSAAKLGAAVNYQSVGSGAGIQQIKAGTVDFAGTDSPLTVEACNEAGLQQFPMLSGAVVPIVNLPGVKANTLKLSLPVLADLFLGKITRWDDPQIVALNPDMKLPKLSVTVVHRSDSSGTSFVYTSFLSAASESWKTTVGAGPSVKWPVGLGGQKNPGVCNSVAKVKGAIGYTEYTYALEAKLTTVLLPAKEGTAYVAPSTAAWPCQGVTYMLMRKDTPEAKLVELKKYFRWCFAEGDTEALRLHYLPLPKDQAQSIVETYLQ